MNREDKLKLIESMEANANRLLNDIAILKAELSGGSDSSNLKPSALSNNHKEQLLANREKNRLKK